VTDAEVIVVGGGPSGAIAAMLLARAGIDVLIVDRAAFPRAKPCGDCLSAEATNLLDRNRLLGDVLARPHAELKGWRIFAPAGHSFAAEFSDVAYSNSVRGAIAIERALLDEVLLGSACAAGARLMQDTRVQDVVAVDGAVNGVVARDNASDSVMTLRARHVIGADGLRSVMARRLGAITRTHGVRKLSLTLHVDALLPFDDYGEMHVGDGICIGVAAVDQRHNRWNVTLVADSNRFGRDAAADAHAFFTRSAESLNGIRDRIPADVISRSMDSALASGPFDVPTRRIAFRGATLLGDAAGYFDPFTGQGVYHGMRSAEILAACLIHELRTRGGNGAVLRDFAHRARAVTRAPRRLQRAIDAVLSRPAVANRVIRRISRAPAAARALVDVTGDVAPVRTLFRPRVGASLLFPDEPAP
jgi:flavin-dependent dehydrogenase